MQAFKVSDFRLISRLNQCLEAGANQLAGAAAEDYLLAEEIGLGLFGEVGLDDAGARGADALGVGQRQILGLAAGVLVDGDERGNAASFLVLAAHQMAGALGGDHDHVDVRWRHNLVEVNVKTMGEHEYVARLEAGGDPVAVGLGLGMVGRQNHDHVAGGRRFGDGDYLEARGLGFLDAGAAAAQPHDHVHAGLLQVEGMSVALTAVTDDGDSLVLDQIEIRILFVIHGAPLAFWAFWGRWLPLLNCFKPTRTLDSLGKQFNNGNQRPRFIFPRARWRCARCALSP